MLHSSMKPGTVSPRHQRSRCPGVGLGARGLVPSHVARASDSEPALAAMHAKLLKEIEDRRRRQSDLLKKLNKLSMTTVTQPETPPQPVAPKPVTPQPVVKPAPELGVEPGPYLERKTPQPDPIIPYEEPPPQEHIPEPLAGPNVMNVVMVGAECAPWSKTGGLGDVVAALPKALRRRGHRVMVIAPRYGNYQEAFDTGVRIRISMFGSDQEVGYFHAYIDDVDYVFIDHPCFHGREKEIYGGGRVDLQFRTALLSKAAIEAVWHVPCGGVPYGDSNLAFIANDWHTAMLPVYLQAHYRDYGKMTYARCIFVIHNMAHQGRGPFNEVHNFELSDEYKSKFFLDDPVGGEHMNILKAGLECSHRLVAVSHGYAWECKTQDGGWGLHSVLQKDEWKLSGIVNGIDYKEWSPQVDVFLQSDGYKQYTLDSLDEGKSACKRALQRELGLPENPDVPLMGFIGRLDYQKGVDLIANSIDWIVSQGAQIVFLGSGRQDLEDSLRHMEGSHRDNVRSWVGFSVQMAHRITAGSDILLMPSRFEPCGLNQLYAMAYGTVPVVHAVGGLRDTVHPYNPNDNTGTGWTFDSADEEKMRTAIYHSIDTFYHHRDSFKGISARGMCQDLSWDNAAKQYEDILVAAKYQW